MQPPAGCPPRRSNAPARPLPPELTRAAALGLLALAAWSVACDLFSSTPPSPSPAAAAVATPTPSPTPTPTPTPSPGLTLRLEARDRPPADVAAVYVPLPGLVRPRRVLPAPDGVFLLDEGKPYLLIVASRSLRPLVPDGEPSFRDPLGLALAGDGALLVLDRPSDLYRYDQGRGWSAAIPAGQVAYPSNAYFAAVAAAPGGHLLLDVAHGWLWQGTGAQAQVVAVEARWRYGVDVAARDDAAFVLADPPQSEPWLLKLFPGQGIDYRFQPGEAIEGPVALVSHLTAGLGVIDREGARLLILDATTGDKLASYLLPNPASPITGAFEHSDALYLVTEAGLFRIQPTPPPGGLRPIAVPSTTPAERRLAAETPLTPPVRGAVVPADPQLLPGAPRYYRGGVHEGVDFFSGQGLIVSRATPALAAADGTVVRADLDYRPPSPLEMAGLLARGRALAGTTAPDLDRLRGRQVWLDHGDGFATRYAHLAAVASGLTEGARVSRGQVLGYAGNSGTPEALDGPDVGVHLHFEVWLGQRYLGQGIAPTELRRRLRVLFGQ